MFYDRERDKEKKKLGERGGRGTEIDLCIKIKKNKKDKMPLHIKCEVVQQVSNYKYLGVTIDLRLHVV